MLRRQRGVPITALDGSQILEYVTDRRRAWLPPKSNYIDSMRRIGGRAREICRH